MAIESFEIYQYVDAVVKTSLSIVHEIEVPKEERFDILQDVLINDTIGVFYINQGVEKSANNILIKRIRN